MTRRRFTITTVGLTVRDELRVKSMLRLVEGRTAAVWTYIDELQADLAVCEPDSALAQAAIRQAAQNGRPRCVSLLRHDAEPLPNMQCVYAPLRASDFISMLDATTAIDEDHARPPAEPTVDAELEAEGHASEASMLADTLRDIAANGGDHLHRIDIASVTLYLTPSHDCVLASEALTPPLIGTLARTDRKIEVQYASAGEAPSAEAGYHRHSLKYLLWHFGIAGPTADLLPWLPRTALFRLSRWPDFGRLGHTSWHVRLSALLIKKGYTLQQMTTLAGRPLSDIRAFINACALCGVLEHEPLHAAASGMSAREDAPPPDRSGRWAGILRSIRTALRIGEH